MTPADIHEALLLRFPQLQSDEEHWEVELEGQRLVVVADEESDRMRVMVPVAAVDRPDATAFRRLLEANFASPLDARYAIYHDVLWSVYLAPLSVLSEPMLDLALGQVLELARSTGTSYSSTPVALGAGCSQLH